MGPRVEEAMWRSVRWLDRCIERHEQSGKQGVQNLFAIVQGGLDPTLRDACLEEMIKRKDRVAGYAIGGLSGGEEKGKPREFYKILSKITFLFGRRILENVRVLYSQARELILTPISIAQCAAKLPADRKDQFSYLYSEFYSPG